MMLACRSTGTLLFFLVNSPVLYWRCLLNYILYKAYLWISIAIDKPLAPDPIELLKPKGSHLHRRNTVDPCKCKTNITSLPHSLYLKFTEHHQSKLVVWTNMNSTVRRDCCTVIEVMRLLAMHDCDDQPHTGLFVCHFLNKIMKLITAACPNKDI